MLRSFGIGGDTILVLAMLGIMISLLLSCAPAPTETPTLEPTEEEDDEMALELTSEAFDAGQTIPTAYTCEGGGVSPPLTWENAPADTKSFVLIADDPDAPGGLFSHWVLYNIPADKRGLEEDVPAESQLSWGGVQGRNDFGDVGYGPPCPPAGSEHRYYFRLYALNGQLDLPPGATRAQVLDAIEGIILEQTELVGVVGR